MRFQVEPGYFHNFLQNTPVLLTWGSETTWNVQLPTLSLWYLRRHPQLTALLLAGTWRESGKYTMYLSYFTLRRGNTSWKQWATWDQQCISMEVGSMPAVGHLSSPDMQNSWNQATLTQYDSSVAIEQHPKNKTYIMCLPCWAWIIAQCLNATKMVSLGIHSYYCADCQGQLWQSC